MNATRFAPSPTGRMHIGNVRALVMSYLWAVKNQAKFILRMDDTDYERSKPELIQSIYDDVKWLGIRYDRTFKQSDRIAEYQSALEKCIELGIVYPVYENKDEIEIIKRGLAAKRLPPAYKRCNAKFIPDRPCYYRFDIGSDTVTFEDKIKGAISINLGSIADPIISKPNGEFTYIFASVVDDLLENITMVIRGGDHVTNTATQVEMIRKMIPIFGEKHIDFAHYPIFSESGAKMSKRNDSISMEYITQEFHPLTIMHYASNLGSNSPIEAWPTNEELANSFNLSSYSSSSLIEFAESDLHKWQHRVLSILPYSQVSEWQAMKADFAWETIRECISSKSDIQYWDRVFTDKISFVTTIDPKKSMVNKKTYTIFLRQVLTGRPSGPKIADIVKVLPEEIYNYRVEHCRFIPCKLYNTLTRSEEEFLPINLSNVKIYACGPTIYKSPHIGNARSFVVFDVLNRLMAHFFHTTYVQNITDVDDKIVAECASKKLSFAELVEPIYAEFKDNMAKLNVLSPKIEPRVTKYIPQIITAIQSMIQSGHAYVAEDGVYFKIDSIENYDLFHCCEKNGTRSDFALWKFKEGLGWESPWRYGRPGWHIECTVMSKDTLGLPFDIHCGGKDLIFPHHTNECAQACALGNPTTANYWMHNNFINVDDLKMSKSLDNFVELSTIPNHPMIVRVALLLSHYRDPMNWTESLLIEATSLYNKWRRALGEMEATTDAGVASNDVLECLLDDLNTPAAIRKLNEIMDKSSKNDLIASFELVGITFTFDYLKDNEIIQLMHARDVARQSKNFALADEIKSQLIAKQVEIFDNLSYSSWYIPVS